MSFGRTPSHGLPHLRHGPPPPARATQLHCLGGYAHLQSLRRTFVGTFGLAEAHSLEAIEADPAACTLSPASMVRGLASIALDPPQSAVVRHGGVFALDALPIGDNEGPFALLDGDELIAVYERRGSGLKASVVVALPVESA